MYYDLKRAFSHLPDSNPCPLVTMRGAASKAGFMPPPPTYKPMDAPGMDPDKKKSQMLHRMNSQSGENSIEPLTRSLMLRRNKLEHLTSVRLFSII
jgi:hypothetical protein